VVPAAPAAAAATGVRAAPPAPHLDAPRPIRATAAALGQGRQRLALLLGGGTVGQAAVVTTAPRDVEAFARTLAAGGFVVMRREDVPAAEWRAALADFRRRLTPEAVGVVYATALGAQVEGQNLLLARDTALEAVAPAAELPARLKAGGVPLAELVEALAGPSGSPRFLLVDAAHAHPALARLQPPGLAEPRLPPGTMALFGQALGATQAATGAVEALAEPLPLDAREIAVSRFARVVIDALAQPGVNGPTALRNARRALADAAPDGRGPWLGGEANEREEFAELTIFDAFVPRTPEEVAREAGRQAVQRAGRASAARPGGGEVVAGEGAQLATGPAGSAAEGVARAGGGAARPPDPALAQAAAAPSGSAVGALAAAGNVASTALGVAGTAAVVGAAAKAAEVAAVATAATAATTATTTAASTAAGMAAGAAGALAGVAGQAAALAAGPSGAAGSAAALGGGGAAAAGSGAGTGAASATPPATAPRPGMAPGSPAMTLATPPATPPATAAAATAAGSATAAPAAPTSPARTTPHAAGTPSAPGAPATSGAGELPATALASSAISALPAGDGGRPASPRAGPGAGEPAPDGHTTRVGERGERPLYRPPSNRFGHAEGDTYTYRLLDVWKDEARETFTTAIEEVLPDGGLLGNGRQLVLDPQGRARLVRRADGSQSEFEPYEALWWADPKRGEDRRVLFTETFRRAGGTRGATEFEGSSSVGRPRKVETPAGEFEALPIASDGWFTETLANGARSQGRWERTVWYAPKLGHPVAIDIRDWDRAGKLLRRERVELMHAQTQRLGQP
jgi:hypothetical protein